MLYAFSKVAWFLVKPSSLLVLSLIVGLMLASGLSWRRAGLRMAWLASLGILACGLLPVGTLLLLPLESRFQTARIVPGDTRFDAIIVLGGGEDGRISRMRGQLHINEAGERVTQAATLGRMLPAARLAFAGGVAFSVLGEMSAADFVRLWWREMGIADERIVTEGKSRNTYENARFIKDVVGPISGKQFLLVTSAAHMPRAMGVFRKAGFDVTAYPVDYRTGGTGDLTRLTVDLVNGLQRVDDASKEWVGLISYWWLGRTSVLFPSG